MAQERVDDFFQMAKYYAKAEKDLGVQRWVFIGFERKDGYNYIRLFSYDLPREVFERRRWVIEWRKARLVCQYPKDNVRYTLHFYDKRLGLDVRLNEDLNKLIAAKAQECSCGKVNYYRFLCFHPRNTNYVILLNHCEEPVRFYVQHLIDRFYIDYTIRDIITYRMDYAIKKIKEFEQALSELGGKDEL